MLRYQKIDVSERINVNKTNASKECKLCHYWFFKDVGFKFDSNVCNRCHDLLTMAHSLKNIAILSAKGATFKSILMGISKNEGKCKYLISPKIRQILLHLSCELTKKDFFNELTN